MKPICRSGDVHKRWGRALAGVFAAACSFGAMAQEGRDPTVPPQAWLAAQPPETDASGAKLSIKSRSSAGQMTLIGKSRRFAVVDGKVLRAGDEHNGTKVMSVKKDKVVMDDEGKSLQLSPASVSKTKPNRQYKAKGAVTLPVESPSTMNKGV